MQILLLIKHLCFAFLTVRVSRSNELYKVTSGGDVTVIQLETASFAYIIEPWPPYCPCLQQDPHLNVTLHFANVTGNKYLCDVTYYNGTFLDQTGLCSSYEQRMMNYEGGSSLGASFHLRLANLYDIATYALTLSYYDWPIGNTTRTDEGRKVSEPPLIHVTSQSELTVQAAPALPRTSLTPDGVLQDGQTVSMQCNVTGASPPADLVWKYDGYMVVQPTHYQKASSWTDYSVSVITVTVSRYDNGRTYTCYASNSLNINTPTTSSISLSVLYGPYVEVSPCLNENVKYDVKEGETASFTCQVESNPDNITALWWYQKSDNSEVLLSGPEPKPTIHIGPVTRYSSTHYGCEADNGLDKSPRRYCELNVLYSPSIAIDSPPAIDEGSNLFLECKADANPPVTEYRWTKSTNNSFVIYNQTLAIINAQVSDAANYTCYVTNDVSGLLPDQETVTVYVTHSPQWRQYSLNKFTGRELQSSSLTCDIQAYPAATFRWKFNSADIVDGNGVRITNEAERSILHITDTTTSDLGKYACEASNSKGYNSFELFLLAPGVPDEPQYCTAVNVTANTAVLECIPGWDGGEAVNYYVEKREDRKNYALQATTGYEGSKAVINLFNLHPLTEYRLAIYGHNIHGTSKLFYSLTIYTLAGEPIASPIPGPDVGVVVGGIIGVAIGVSVLVVLGLICYMRYEPKSPNESEEDANDDESNSETSQQSHTLSEPLSTLTAFNTQANKYNNYQTVDAKTRLERNKFPDTQFQNYYGSNYSLYGNNSQWQSQMQLTERRSQSLQGLQQVNSRSNSTDNLIRTPSPVESENKLIIKYPVSGTSSGYANYKTNYERTSNQNIPGRLDNNNYYNASNRHEQMSARLKSDFETRNEPYGKRTYENHGYKDDSLQSNINVSYRSAVIPNVQPSQYQLQFDRSRPTKHNQYNGYHQTESHINNSSKKFEHFTDDPFQRNTRDITNSQYNQQKMPSSPYQPMTIEAEIHASNAKGLFNDNASQKLGLTNNNWRNSNEMLTGRQRVENRGQSYEMKLMTSNMNRDNMCNNVNIPTSSQWRADDRQRTANYYDRSLDSSRHIMPSEKTSLPQGPNNYFSRTAELEQSSQKSSNQNIRSEEIKPQAPIRKKHAHFRDREWECSRDSVHLEKKLGMGSFGIVWKCLCDRLPGENRPTAAAIKIGHTHVPSLKVLKAELKVLKTMRPHPNILRLLGCCSTSEPISIILELADYGNLQQFLRNSRRPVTQPFKSLTFLDLIVFNHQIANGMEYIARKQYIHRDLATRNVLVDSSLTCKLSDFGPAEDIIQIREYQSKTLVVLQCMMPLRWLSPESLLSNIFDSNTDIWSFGILLWEIITLGASPYPNMKSTQVRAFVIEGRKMEKPKLCSNQLYDIMTNCWHYQAESRPTFSSLKMQLELTIESLRNEPSLNVLSSQMTDNFYDIITYQPGEKC